MPITVNTNMSSLICQRSLTKATSGMNTALERMSTGLKINSAKDDAAGSAISSKLDYKLSSYAVAQDNAQMGQSMLDTASGSLSVMNNMLQRMRDLSEQAANGTYGTEERQAMQAEVDALTKELYRIKNTTDFNGKKILGEEEIVKREIVNPEFSISDIDINTITQSEWNSNYKGHTIGISSAEDLAKLATITNTSGINSQGTTFVVTDDIDLSNYDNWTPIGKDSTGNALAFKGNFDGNNFTISNLKITDNDNTGVGLFGNVYASGEPKASIRNICLENVYIDTGNKCKNVGAIAGRTYITEITNCTVSGNIFTSDFDKIGGIVGYLNKSKVTDCSSSVNVTTTSQNVGGLIGNSYESIVENCNASGNVKGKQTVGGLIGKVSGGGSVSNCYSSGNTRATDNEAGGLIGYNNGGIENCTSTSSATGKRGVGGLIGLNGGYGTVTNCKSGGNVNGNDRVGGLVGANMDSSNIIDSATCSTVTGNDAATTGAFLGTLMGGTISGACQYNSNKSGSLPPIGNTTSSAITDNKNLSVSTPQKKSGIDFLINLQIGINSDKNSIITVNSGFELGDINISLESESSAKKAIGKIDSMLNKIGKKSLELGSTSNRLESVMEFQNVQMSTITSANSLIKDADIAKESASYIKNQILQQTTATLLATANQNPSIALSLL